MPGAYWCRRHTTCAWKNRPYRLPPKKDDHVYIARSTYQYAYARQVNWKKERNKRKEDKGEEIKYKGEEKRKGEERREKNRQEKPGETRREQEARKGKERRKRQRKEKKVKVKERKDKEANKRKRKKKKINK